MISESVRGEGAYLFNKDGERFVDELLPRDIVTAAIREQMEKDGTDYVRLSVTHLDGDRIRKRFPNIYKQCLEEGYDMTKEWIPVTPAQHYFMGGIKVDLAVVLPWRIYTQWERPAATEFTGRPAGEQFSAGISCFCPGVCRRYCKVAEKTFRVSG